MCGGPPGDYSAKSDCNHIYATSKLNGAIKGGSDVLVLRYFPNLIEHRDIINLACDGLGSLEELGITLCNMKINIIEPVPGDWMVLRTSHDFRKTSANILEFDLDVPSKEETILEYRIRVIL